MLLHNYCLPFLFIFHKGKDEAGVLRSQYGVGGGDTLEKLIGFNLKEMGLTKNYRSSEKIIDYFEYYKTINLSSYADGTSFLLKLKSCSDHDCINFLEREFTFTI